MSYRPKLFAGIELNGPTRKACAAISARLDQAGLRARFESAEKLHITVAFLGWVDPEQVEPITRVIRETAQTLRAFHIGIDKLGAFPHERNPHIVWVGSRRRNTAFDALSNRLRSAFEDLGFTFTKEAVPHVTLARIKERHVHLPVIDVAPMRMPVKEITLFESLPAGRTTRYEIRSRAALLR